MSEQKESFFGQLKNQLVATIGLIITAAGGLVIANMESIFGVEEPVAIEQPSMEQTIVIPETEKDTIVISKTIIQTEKKEYDW